jgi:hypothetical protein
MKRRILSSVVLAGGLMALGITGASAHTYCSLDPTYNVGLPVHYNLNVNVATGLASVDLYASGTSHTTTFGGGLGLLP